MFSYFSGSSSSGPPIVEMSGPSIMEMSGPMPCSVNAKHRIPASSAPVIMDLSSVPVIMDFTGTYGEQPFARAGNFNWLDCRGIHGTDCYCDEEGEAALRELIAAFSPYSLHFLDSGNYHYLTKLWTDRIREPFSLVLFDHHTDMQPPMFEGLLSCGGWVKKMLDTNPFLRKVMIAGVPESEAVKVRSERVLAISEEEWMASGLRAFEPVPALFCEGQSAGGQSASRQSVGAQSVGAQSVGVQSVGVQFTGAQSSGVQSVGMQSLSGYGTCDSEDIQSSGIPIYISVDKDVLSKDFASTNWDQGGLTLELLSGAISMLFDRFNVIGMDVCGEPDSSDVLFSDKACMLNSAANERLLAMWQGLGR